MPTLSALPPECLWIMIRQLADQHDTVTLAALLRVNKYFCTMTLPILYQNPFDLIAPVSFEPELQSWYVSSVTKLARTLLLSMPDCHQQEFSQLLRVVFLTVSSFIDTASNQEEDQLSTKPSLFPYYSYITVIFLKSCFGLPNSIFRDIFFSSNPALTDYLATAPIHPDVVLWGTEDEIPVKATFRALQRDLTWALCANAKRIQSLVIPLSDIDRYRSLVCRFKVLSDVSFLQEGQYEYTRIMSIDEENILRLQQPVRTALLEKMILFVQEHQQKHGAILRTSRCNGRLEDELIPEKFKQRLFLLLQPLSDPRSLDDSNWDQFLAKFQEIDLSFVRNISPSLNYGGSAAIQRLINQGPFLHRCRTLDSFTMESPGDDVFQWAVYDRMSHDADIEAGRIPQKPLVPLRVFKVPCYHNTLGRQLNDVVFAFDKTLEIISTSCGWNVNNAMSNDVQVEHSSFRVGGGGDNSFASWDLPRLTKLDLRICYPSAFLCLAPDLLTRLPQLTYLKLTDRRHGYKPSEIVSWHSASLPNLVNLILIGTPAISFNPETLKGACSLVRMDLQVHDSSTPDVVLFIPSTEELEESFAHPSNETTMMPTPPLKRPLWTWDWDLPKLTEMFLNAEFAYRFEFRMLVGTPNLKSFSVVISSFSRDYKRTLSLSDLLIPGFDHPSLASIMDEDRQFHESYVACEANDRNITVATTAQTEYGGQESGVKDAPETTKVALKDRSTIWDELEYLSLPFLKSFNLGGIWTMSRQTLALLFEKVIPNVEYVHMNQTRGYSWKDWEELKWGYLSKLKEAHCSLTIDPGRERNAVIL